MASELRPGNWLELIPRDPPATVAGLVWVVYIETVELPRLGVTDRNQGFLMRLDENNELAVRELDRSLWEVGRTFGRAVC